MICYEELEELGYELFGPILAKFICNFAQKVIYNNKPVMFFSREGFFLKKLVQNQLIRYNEYDKIKLLKYIYCSRNFLHKLSLSDYKSIKFALDHPYRGSFFDFMNDRFLISEEYINIKYDFLVQIPQEKNNLIEYIYKSTNSIRNDIDHEKEIYRKYIFSQIKSTDVICCDIGFSCTTQKLLNSIFDIDIYGYYMYLSPKTKNEVSCPAEGIILDDIEMGSGNYLVDYSLILESLLTSPDGQFSGIEIDNNCYSFKFKRKSKTQKFFYYLYPIISGVDKFIDKYDRCTSVDNIVNNEVLYKLYIEFTKTNAMKLFTEISEVDDSISGFDFYSPFKIVQK